MIEEDSEIYARLRVIAIKLVEQFFRDSDRDNGLRELGVVIRGASDSYNISDAVLDILRVPKDTTLEVFDFDKQDFRDGYNKDDLFSRDSLVDYIYSCSHSAEAAVDGIIDVVKNEGWARAE
jgi:hypothetical protein